MDAKAAAGSLGAARLLPPPAAQSWAEALPVSTSPAERLFFGAPCKQATNSALPRSAGGGVLLLHKQWFTGCAGRALEQGGQGWSGRGLPAWVPTRVKTTGS